MLKRTSSAALHAFALIASIMLTQPLAAQTQFNDRWHSNAPKPDVPKNPEPAQKPAEKLPVDLNQALYLIRSTLLTLNDANRSGNYTVLRDLSAPAFQAKNSAADLAHNFADLRKRRFDLFAAALLAPTLSAAPQIDANGMLNLSELSDPAVANQVRYDLPERQRQMAAVRPCRRHATRAAAAASHAIR